MSELSEEAKAARSKYQRDWQKKNPDYNKNRLRKRRKERPELQKIYDARKWEKKARELDNKENKVTVTQNKVSVTAEPGQKVCINCGSFYKPKRVTARYCSDKCRVNYNRKYKS